jgi:hypothetical protein
MPNVHYLPHQPIRPVGLTPEQTKATAVTVFALLGAIAITGFLFVQFGGVKKPLRPNSRKKMFHRNRRRLSGGCRTGQGPYLFPKEQAYPVPTLRCAKTALTYAAWPRNIQDAPAVIKAMKRSKWGKRADIRAQMKKLASRYSKELHTKAPRV